MNICIEDESQTVQFEEYNRRSYRILDSGKVVSFKTSYINNFINMLYDLRSNSFKDLVSVLQQPL